MSPQAEASILYNDETLGIDWYCWQSRKCYYLRKTERELPLKMPLILNEFLNKQ